MQLTILRKKQYKESQNISQKNGKLIDYYKYNRLIQDQSPHLRKNDSVPNQGQDQGQGQAHSHEKARPGPKFH